jgi:hypothetical protein
MTHRIELKEDKNGYYTVNMNGRNIAYGLTKDQADFYIRGMEQGFEEAGHSFVRNDEFYRIMCQ